MFVILCLQLLLVCKIIDQYFHFWLKMVEKKDACGSFFMLGCSPSCKVIYQTYWLALQPHQLVEGQELITKLTNNLFHRRQTFHTLVKISNKM